MNIIKKHDLEYVKSKKIIIKDYECYQTHNRLPNLPIISQMRPKFMFNHINAIDKRFYDTKCYLTNIMNYKNFLTLNKDMLYFTLRDYYPEILKKHMKPSFYINEIYSYNFPKVYILRPIFGSGGAEIFYISSKNELIKAIEYYKSNNKFFKRLKFFHNYKVLASEYEMNPLLYKTKKFNIRMYYIISVINGVLSGFFLESGDFITAAKPFNTIKPFSKDVHDTHFKSTKEDIFFPEAFKDSNLNVKGLKSADILAQMRLILSAVTSTTIKVTKNMNTLLYDNQKNGYNLYGVDFMVNDTGTVLLIEINGTPGIGFNDPKNTPIFCKTLFDWVSECVLEPCFKGTDATKHPTYLHPI